MNRKIVIIFLILAPAFLHAQDSHFSQFIQAPLLQNPALEGAEPQTRLLLNYRDQWRLVGAPFTTTMFSAVGILVLEKNTSDVLVCGMNLFRDKAMSHVQANASAARHAPMGPNSNIGAGSQFSYARRSLISDNLKWGSQFDGFAFNLILPGGLPVVSERRGFANQGAGIVWQYRHRKNYMTGNDQRQVTAGPVVFLSHWPDRYFFQTIARLASTALLYTDAFLGLSNNDLALYPAFLVASQDPLTETAAVNRLWKVFERQSTNTGFFKGKVASTGTAFLLGDAILSSLSIELDPIDIGSSYDINILLLNAANRGGREASVRYLLSHPKKT